MANNLVIVESPAKARTIEGFLGKDFLVKSSMGHVRDLSTKNLSVDVGNNFLPHYEISSDKQKIVKELKKMAGEANTVWLASDEDREGEAISWHLIQALDISDDKVKRIVFHEITKSAIEQAVSNPRGIDMNLVDAQQARRVLDRLVGYEVSPILWKKVRPALSAGRVQSVAVRLIVEREEEIKTFQTTSSFRITAEFTIVTKEEIQKFEAELATKFSKKEEALAFLRKCINAGFVVTDIETKPLIKSPAPPFTTSTLQQEASRKLSFSVANTMRIAQQLYESGKITYMRTDSVNLSNLALGMAKEVISRNYGADYVKTRKYTTKTKGAQEAHEAIRPTYLNNTEIQGSAAEKKLYDLIWKRTIASQMSNAILEKTNITIDVSTVSEKFIASGEVIKFDGFLKIYRESSDDENQESQKGMLPVLHTGDKLELFQMTAAERFSQPPPRYSEASLVKKLEELGIGRPSTYAPIISTIQKREYVSKGDTTGATRMYEVLLLKNAMIREEQRNEKIGYTKGKLLPTDIGILVNNFLIQNFKNILDYNFTASVEKEFDEIARGKKQWNAMLKEFYKTFHQQIEKAKASSEKVKGERLLGSDPATSKNVYVKLGKYGPIVQLGDTDNTVKPRFAALKKNQSLESMELADALELFKLPRAIGDFEGANITVAIGRYGPYISHKNSFYSLPDNIDPLVITIEQSIQIIEAKRKQDEEKIIKIFKENEKVKVLKGKYGPYISIERKNFRIPKGKDPQSLTLDDCLNIARESKSSGGKKQWRRKK